jgi:hypothetical protein
LSDNKIRLVIVQPASDEDAERAKAEGLYVDSALGEDEREYATLAGVAYNPHSGAAEYVSADEASDFVEFAKSVCEDMDELMYRLTMWYAKRLKEHGIQPRKLHPEERTQVFSAILMELNNMPGAVAGNIAASSVLACIEESMEDPELDAHLKAWNERNQPQPE